MPDITLTFDNGPTPGVTEDVLGILASRGVRATFFVVGTKLAEDGARELAVLAHEQGHWIGNHTWSHSMPFGEWPEWQDPTNEILRTQHLMGDLAHPDRFFRAPAGGGHLDQRLLSARALECIQEQAMTLVLWNAIPRDWDDPDGWVETALRQVRSTDWTVMVLHDVATGAMSNLPRFIDAVLECGGRFRQDFPRNCVPVLRGKINGPIERYMSQKEARKHIR